VVARFNGGANAGHTVVVGEGASAKKFAFHLLPCGLIHPHTVNLLGNGTVIHLESLFSELAPLDGAGIDWQGRLKISDRATLLFDFHQVRVSQRSCAAAGGGMHAARCPPSLSRRRHSPPSRARAPGPPIAPQMVDGLSEERAKASSAAIGTTKQGIGPAYASKAQRLAVRAGHLAHRASLHARLRALIAATSAAYDVAIDAEAEIAKVDAVAARAGALVVDGSALLHGALARGQRVLAEGANAAMLDLDHGTFPYVTSSSTTAGGVCTGLGLPPARVAAVVGVVKAYTTRVGGGPFPSELTDARGGGERPMNAEGTETGLHLQKVGGEVGVT
jgi:adenylosuccinate synthase